MLKSDPIIDEKQIQEGCYEITHYGSSAWPPGYEQYPKFKSHHSSYGVCDNLSQILQKIPEIEQDQNRQFIITLTPVIKKNQSRRGGWRWHKWGEYIGTQEPTTEYLYDEPIIKKVYAFHIYEKKNPTRIKVQTVDVKDQEEILEAMYSLMFGGLKVK